MIVVGFSFEVIGFIWVRGVVVCNEIVECCVFVDKMVVSCVCVILLVFLDIVY